MFLQLFVSFNLLIELHCLLFIGLLCIFFAFDQFSQTLFESIHHFIKLFELVLQLYIFFLGDFDLVFDSFEMLDDGLVLIMFLFDPLVSVINFLFCLFDLLGEIGNYGFVGFYFIQILFLDFKVFLLQFFVLSFCLPYFILKIIVLALNCTILSILPSQVIDCFIPLEGVEVVGDPGVVGAVCAAVH